MLTTTKDSDISNNDSPSDITLSSLSGDELLNILKQSLGKNLNESKETKESLANLLSHSLSNSKQKSSEKVHQSIEMSTPPPSGINSTTESVACSDEDADSAARNLLHDLLQEKNMDIDSTPMEISPNPNSATTVQVSVELPIDAVPTKEVQDKQSTPIDPNFPFSLGKLASSLSTSETLSSFKSSLNKKLTSIKLETEKKKDAVQSIREKTGIAKEQYEKAIKHLEMALVAYKDAESEIKSLESMCEWISSFEQSCQQSVQDLISCIASPLPLEWKSMVGPHVCLVLNDGKSSGDVKDPDDDGLTLKMIDFEENCNPKSSRVMDRPLSSSTVSNSVSHTTHNGVNNEVNGNVQKRKSSTDLPDKPYSSTDDICLSYNRNDCYSSSCRRLHACLYCGSTSHPVTKCGSDKTCERIMCVQYNVDHTKCVGSDKCVREHRCLRCCSKKHSINDCPIMGPTKASSRTFCYLYNASSINFCNNRDCKRYHSCLRCGRNHGALNCPENVNTYLEETRFPGVERKKMKAELEKDAKYDVKSRLGNRK